MSEQDALSKFKFPKSQGKFMTFESGQPIKLRVLTIDPVVSMDKWGGTKFAFVVYNHTDQKAQILNRGASIAKEIQALHQDEDYGANIKNIDIKITANGEGKETRYTVVPLPQAINLTKEQINEAREIDLEQEIENGQRMSLYDPKKYKEEPSGSLSDKWKEEKEKKEQDVVDEDIGDEPINLDDIPF